MIFSGPLRVYENFINEQPGFATFGLMPVGNRSKVFGVNAKMARFHFFDLCREDAGVDRFFLGNLCCGCGD